MLLLFTTSHCGKFEHIIPKTRQQVKLTLWQSKTAGQIGPEISRFSLPLCGKSANPPASRKPAVDVRHADLKPFRGVTGRGEPGEPAFVGKENELVPVCETGSVARVSGCHRTARMESAEVESFRDPAEIPCRVVASPAVHVVDFRERIRVWVLAPGFGDEPMHGNH